MNARDFRNDVKYLKGNNRYDICSTTQALLSGIPQHILNVAPQRTKAAPGWWYRDELNRWLKLLWIESKRSLISRSLQHTKQGTLTRTRMRRLERIYLVPYTEV